MKRFLQKKTFYIPAYLLFIFAIIFLLKLLIPKPPILENLSFSQAIYDDNHKLLRLTLTPDQKYRLYTPLKDMSPLVIQATLLQEDRYFYWHPGINPIALVKGMWLTYVVHTRPIGASTITMQTARLLYHINSRTISGKLLQIYRALELEFLYSKYQILEAYLNLASYGGNIEGVGSASLIYFAKPASQLTLPEALTLAVIPQNPLQRKPDKKHLTILIHARNRLFSRWIDQHPQDKSQQGLVNLPWQLTYHFVFLAPHFVTDIIKKYPHESVINTTLDYRLQNTIKQVAENYLSREQQFGIKNYAVMLVDTRNMSVKALVGSANFFDKNIQGQVDGTQAKRSPGSTLKPFIYGLALDQGLIHPYTMLHDAPTHFGTYTPDNFDKDFMGPVLARDALVLSRNIPAITLASELKHPTLYDLLTRAHVAGLKPENAYGLSLVLGGAEVTMAELSSLYAILANNGKWHPLRYTIDQQQTPGTSLLSPEASFLILDMLKNTPRPFALNYAIQQNISVSWKTGTSSGYRDAWSAGIFGPYVLTVWLGNFNGERNPELIGAVSAAPLFFSLVDAITEQTHITDIDRHPEKLNLKQVKVCATTGMLPTRLCPQLATTWFIPGKSPIKHDNIYREIAIDNKTGLRACAFDKNVHFAVYEFWPSDLLQIFSQAGIARQTPPAFAPHCGIVSNTSMPPQITSPQNDLVYTVRINNLANEKIMLQATTAADVKKIFWFMDNTLLGETAPNQTFIWQAKPGHYRIRVVDDHGQSDVTNVTVEAVE